MAIRVKLHHQTTYDYDRAVNLGPQNIRLRPAPHTRTPLAGYSLRVEPNEHFVNWQQDPQSNWIARIVVPKPAKRFRVTVDLIADLSPINPFDFFLESHAETYPFEYSASLKRELRPYLETLGEGGETGDTPAATGRKFRELVDAIDRSERTMIDFLVMLNQTINQKLGYTLRMEAGVYTPEQTLEKGVGSCRDFAWLLVQVCRSLGLAARFVSGYSIQLAADEKPIDGPGGVSHDVVDLHAWAEVYLPGAGWVGMDATSGMMCTEGHIPLACSPEPGAAAPISGGVEPSGVKFGHEMSVTRVHEDPRVTLPYTEGQWEAIDTLAAHVDKQIDKADMRLTMGGEPTFVSVDDYESAQWNTAAVGKDKLERSVTLIRKLRERFGKGGLLHCGQGKWYPGEPLPRWALAIYWRPDGEPVWASERLLVDPTAAGANLGHTTEDAYAFINGLAGRLGLDSGYVTPAYEDAAHYEKVIAGLPANVTVLENKLENKQDRARLTRVYAQGLERPTGFVLPVLKGRAVNRPRSGWKSSVWDLRSNTETQRRIVCVPGDSPLGLRLPLASLPYTDDPEADKLHPEDPTAKKTALPGHSTLMARVAGDHAGGVASTAADLNKAGAVTPVIDQDDKQLVRLALAVEARDGVLRVFMPPTETAEDYLELIAAVEATAAAISKPVIIEGYEPPVDPRLRNLKVTPDPGVIEVNVQPASSWDELKQITSGLYEDARACRLGTDKYQLDGKHTGTGGGNHVVVGASTPLDSPFLRRPDMLRSVVSYWINHPSLSYLFSGMFIGPTSQAPRVDEGRGDALYELELALDQTPGRDSEEEPEPWLVDRLYRNLLTDLTGNTHRAEICIDKLYSPDSSTGRLGLVEFRGFEMPPHPRMSLTQQLLLRSLLLMFWKQPYVQRPKRWGAQLHDRFLLPHYCAEDLEEVLYDLRTFGIKMDQHWFVPHIEFRFPIAGRIVVDDISIELRSAIEPWYTLGEEPAGGGMTRYVDGSVERLQVLVKGIDLTAGSGRYAVAVNGVELPLQPTASHGEGVCGLRFRAWQPPHCLHPKIPVDTPLVFDVVDRLQGKAIGGGTYHAAHPGGRSYDTFPVNALEAEARRKARFFSFGHTPGPIEMASVKTNRQSPITLDLRRIDI